MKGLKLSLLKNKLCTSTSAAMVGCCWILGKKKSPAGKWRCEVGTLWQGPQVMSGCSPSGAQLNLALERRREDAANRRRT